MRSGYSELNACVHAQLLQSYPTLCDPMDCSPPGSSVHRILQARILEWLPSPSPDNHNNTRIKYKSIAKPPSRILIIFHVIQQKSKMVLYSLICANMTLKMVLRKPILVRLTV